MAPNYPAGSLVITTKLIKPSLGAVCAYRHNDIIVVHRIIADTEDGFIFKGDANNTADPQPVTDEQIAGVMLFGIPHITLQGGSP